MVTVNVPLLSQVSALAVLLLFTLGTALLPLSTTGEASASVSFSDTTVSLGLWEPLLGMHVHAVAWGDVNADGWLDLFVGTFADRPDSVYQVRGGTGPSPDQLLFGGPAGFAPARNFPEMFGRTSGAAFADLDGDGHLDLVISRNYRAKERGDAPTVVLQNDGTGGFTIAATLATDFGGRSIGVLDFDGDGFLDLFIAEDRWSGGSSILLHNLGDFQFVDVTATAGLPTTNPALGVGVGDLNGDGWPDLVVSSSIPEKLPSSTWGARLFLNTCTGGFRELDNTVFTWQTYTNEDDTAGVAIGDLNRDGRPDIVLAHHYSSTLSQDRSVPVRLYLNRGADAQGNPTFEDVTSLSGLAGFTTKAPHVQIADFDNDGWPDILVTASSANGTQGSVLRNLGIQKGIPVFATPEGLGSDQYWPVGAAADQDGDGRLDVFLGEWYPHLPSLLLRNESPSAHWLSVEVAVAGATVGSTVEVYRAGKLGRLQALLGVSEITATTGYGSGIPPVAHFGLGTLATVDVRVRLPHGGDVIDLPRVSTDQRLRVTHEKFHSRRRHRLPMITR